ncbi:amino acid ABC transporter substrate-binding protein [Acidovorax sp. HDW3]|uniref:amino acid ABC transporter substrate-binding protein n=1 Tax=Acidovorax sp. HDW3 TaxID=2714923 RepID=UPI00140B245D|nr:amino acid ABC transporter substrate-binding protein [Acidovorax sp. HDW3]QIL44948.1 amino acid ABC transporter substrate-binding protein [Acidovorax sp. HDW3]
MFSLSPLVRRLCCAGALSLTALSPVSSALAADATLSKIQSTGQLTIGYRQDAAPLSYTDASGKPIGYAVEICQQLASRLQSQLKLPQLQLQYVPVTIAERFDRIADGKIQLECADSTNTKARRERVGFGLTYYYAGARMLVRKDETREQLSQMGQARIAVIAGTTGQQVSERHKGATMVTVASTEEGAKAVAQGRADAFVSDDIALIDQAKVLKGAVKVVGPRMSVEPLAPLVPKNAPEFQALIDQAMKDMYRDGTARQIYRKWFEQPLPTRDYALDLPPDRLLSDTFRRPDGFVTDWTVL